MSQTRKNFIYNLAYQLLSLLIPFITAPYISRTLGADGIGKYSYTYSIVYYFMMFGMIGISTHGNRTIAKYRDNKQELSKHFYSIFSLQVGLNIIMIIAYIIFCLIFGEKYMLISLIEIIFLFSNLIDISWLFFGLEKFKITITRNIIIKLVCLLCVILFVKNPSDVWIYTLIMALSNFLSQLYLLFKAPNELEKVNITIKDIFKELKPSLILFIPIIAVSLYKVMDKIMLGNMASIVDVGYYEQAEKVINIPLGIITALGTVMLPKISNLVYNKKNKEIEDYINKSINIEMFLAFPITFGIIAISKIFVPLFLGTEFTNSIILTCLLALSIPFIAFANVIRTEYLVPHNEDKVFILSVIGGAIVNLIANILLIPKCNAVGACIGTILAESFVMFYQVIAIFKKIPILEYAKNVIPFLIKSIVMFIIIYPISYLHINHTLLVILQVIVGMTIYFILNYKYILNIINIKNILKNKLPYLIKKYQLIKNHIYMKRHINYEKELTKWYEKNSKEKLDLKNPKNFNQKIQYLKIYDSTELKTLLADKYKCREWIKDNIGEKYLTSLIAVYNKFEDIDFNKLPQKFVLKCNHGSGYNYIIKDKNNIDYKSMNRDFNNWMSTNFAFASGFEMQYKNIKPVILCEKYLCESLIDCQFWCSNGKILFISYINNPHGENYKASYNLNWEKLDFVTSLPMFEGDNKKPKNFDEMVDIALKISKLFKFVRVDFYILDNGDIKISEITFTPASGMIEWYPKKYNDIMGKKLKI